MLMSVIGCGRLGAPFAAGMARMGHQVLGLDLDPKVYEPLAQGRAPFAEPGLQEAVTEGAENGSLSFTRSYRKVADFADLHIVCVGTPQSPGRLEADLRDLEAAVEELAGALVRDALIVIKSSVPAGTSARMQALASSVASAGVVVRVAYSPDFLRESTSLADVAAPSRVVIGLGPDDTSSLQVLRETWSPQLEAGAELIVTDWVTAELAKPAANSFMATKISYINVMAQLCQELGGDVEDLAQILGSDPRIGPALLQAGIGFGGSCFPKDLRSLIFQSREVGASGFTLLKAVDHVNTLRQSEMVELAARACEGDLEGRTVAVWGLSFKPGTDDLRDSPALAIALRIADLGARVVAYDPAAAGSAAEAHPHLSYAAEADEAVQGADVLLHLTDWPEFAMAEPADLLSLAKRPVLIDGRNSLPVERWREAGWQVLSLGRP